MNRKLRILGVPGDMVQGACAYYRTIWPLDAIAEHGWADVYIPPAENGRLFVEFNENGQKDFTRLNRANNYDIIVFQRQPEAHIQQLMQACQRFGIKVVYDMDDAALSIPKWNPNYCSWGRDKRRVYQMARSFIESGHIPDALRGKTPEQVANEAPQRLGQLLRNIRQADMLTVTTEALRQEYKRYNSNICVCPNQMQSDYWADVVPIEHSGEIWIGWAGGWTHGKDLQMLVAPIQNILSRYKNVFLVLIGFVQAKELIFNNVPPERVKVFPWHTDFHGYHDAVASLDIVLAPSHDCQFNAAKSDIRVLEGWLCKRPCVTSLVTYGDSVKKCKGGFVAKSNADWLRALQRLIRDPNLRREMGLRGYEYVLSDRTYFGNAHRWWTAYQSLFEGD